MLWRLFVTFLKVGVTAFGGGYAMIPIIEREVVDKWQWIEREEYNNFVVAAQTCPGVFAVNISTLIGYKLRRTMGAVIAALGATLPSFVIICIVAMLWRECEDIPMLQSAFRGLRPAVVALIAVPTFTLARAAKLNIFTVWIPIVSAALIWLLGVNPIIIIAVAAFAGYLLSIRLFT